MNNYCKHCEAKLYYWFNNWWENCNSPTRYCNWPKLQLHEIDNYLQFSN